MNRSNMNLQILEVYVYLMHKGFDFNSCIYFADWWNVNSAVVDTKSFPVCGVVEKKEKQWRHHETSGVRSDNSWVETACAYPPPTCSRNRLKKLAPAVPAPFKVRQVNRCAQEQRPSLNSLQLPALCDFLLAKPRNTRRYFVRGVILLNFCQRNVVFCFFKSKTAAFYFYFFFTYIFNS